MPALDWFAIPRIPEPEVMDGSDEVEAYASATAQTYLDEIDDTFVEHAVRLGIRRGRGLDIGTGPGQIPLKIAELLPQMELIGTDRSEGMLAEGRKQAKAQGLEARVHFQTGDGNRLEFADGTFDLVLCNSVLHHLESPVRVLNEIARVAKPRAAILLRDLRRPARFVHPIHVRWFGRHYSGRMKELYEASVRAAYTQEELEVLLRQSALRGARTFRFGLTHIGIERSESAFST